MIRAIKMTTLTTAKSPDEIEISWMLLIGN